MIRKFLTGVALALALTSCSTVSAMYDAATKPVSMEVVLKSALSVEIAFQAALTSANLYADQAKCGTVGAPMAPFCADPAVVAKMSELAEKADVAVKAMDKVVHENGVSATVAQAAIKAATEAVDAFKAITASAAEVK